MTYFNRLRAFYWKNGKNCLKSIEIFWLRYPLLLTSQLLEFFMAFFRLSMHFFVVNLNGFSALDDPNWKEYSEHIPPCPENSCQECGKLLISMEMRIKREEEKTERQQANLFKQINILRGRFWIKMDYNTFCRQIGWVIFFRSCSPSRQAIICLTFLSVTQQMQWLSERISYQKSSKNEELNSKLCAM